MTKGNICDITPIFMTIVLDMVRDQRRLALMTKALEPTSSRNGATDTAYLHSVRTWMKANHVSYNVLAGKLHLSPGSVRNWFCSRNAPRITEANRRLLDEIMAGTDAETERETVWNFVRMPRSMTNLPLWCDAARVTTATFNNVQSEQTRRFAEWATNVIMRAVEKALDKYKDAQHIVDTVGALDAFFPCTPNIRDKENFYLPVIYPAYRPVLVTMVSKTNVRSKNRENSEALFIANALTKAAEASLRHEFEMKRKPHPRRGSKQ